MEAQQIPREWESPGAGGGVPSLRGERTVGGQGLSRAQILGFPGKLAETPFVAQDPTALRI